MRARARTNEIRTSRANCHNRGDEPRMTGDVPRRRFRKMDWRSAQRQPKRRELSSTETHSSEQQTMAQPLAEIFDCASRVHICGTEAACEIKGTISHCVCPHDKSPPTADLKCPIRATAHTMTNRPAQSSDDSSQEQATEDIPATVEILNCLGRAHICGTEAACEKKGSTSHCVCPHDKSPPTTDLKCPRVTVPLTPNPIPNIILQSSNVTNTTTILPEPAQVERMAPRIPEVTGVALGCLLVLALVIGSIYYCKRRSADAKSKRRDLEASPMNLKTSLLLANKYTPNPQYFSYASPEVPILLRDSLTFLRDIGEGCFGKVFKGELVLEDSKEVVAIKVLKDSASREAEEDFMREVDIMSSFRHENILSLVGVVLRDTSNGPWMVFEYMPYGDLAEVLRANSPTLRAPTPGLQPLSKDSLHWITTQIAAGMAYLAAQRFVHRDLACRNCLVGSGLVVKIADFGMSRDVYTCDYYKIGGSRLLPVRWMSPESVVYGRFTLESDVWSFGVVLWEVYSFGKQPYYGHNNDEVMKLILQGIMLIPPEDCPAYVCQLMRDCWKTEPRDRIRFAEIVERLEKAQDKPSQLSSLPRPPQGPVTIRAPDVLDPDGYLLPSPATLREYFQPIPT
ncbi:muscle, skeletal receptor tyrosine protein kinase-like isoform X1 [Phymastichus coffea]|uniref:muscle, skeletal receptor tyrosine protein kinase-like isoform X1 n=1 Tax=Phymastichus coffea TaxID=108790 RepID=UPI00273BAE0F|nr:muscle, skeletal receptor tyrosine protein kinase-like isoform X1 [Phymastichus coffea]